MKNILFTLIFCFFALTSEAAGTVPALMLTLTDGSAQTFELTSQPLITINDGNLDIKCGKNSLCFKLSEIKDYKFVETLSGIAPVTSQPALSVDEDYITVMPADKSSVISLTTVTGVELLRRTVEPGERCVVGLDGYTAGVYLFTIDSFTTKILIK